jgi:hypothetical protein
MNMRPAALAQLVEHLTRNEKVVSSILTGGSVKVQVRGGSEKSGPFFYAPARAKRGQRRIVGHFIALHRAAPESADRAGLVAEMEPHGQARGEARLDDCELAGVRCDVLGVRLLLVRLLAEVIAAVRNSGCSE